MNKKHLLPIIAVIFLLLATTLASAYYHPNYGYNQNKESSRYSRTSTLYDYSPWGHTKTTIRYSESRKSYSQPSFNYGYSPYSNYYHPRQNYIRNYPSRTYAQSEHYWQPYLHQPSYYGNPTLGYNWRTGYYY